MKNPDGSKNWMINEGAADVVKRIFGMTLEEYGSEQIAAQLEKDKIYTPANY